MTTALKGGVDECVDTLQSHGGLDKTRRQDDDISIVVRTREGSQLGLPAQSSADALVLVERDADAIAGAANGNCPGTLAGFDSRGAWVSIIGIVARVGAMSAEVAASIALSLKMSLHSSLQFISGMVAAQSHDGVSSLSFHHSF